MMKQFRLIAYTALAAVTLCAFTGCSEDSSTADSNSAASTNSSAATENSGAASTGEVSFTYTANGTAIAISAESDPIVAALGTPKSTFEAPSCAFEGTSYTYTYDGFTLETYPDGDVNRVYAITLTDNTVQTAEGIKVGDSIEAVQSACGTPDQTSNFFDMYTTEGMAVQFFYANGDGIVSSIVYTYN